MENTKDKIIKTAFDTFLLNWFKNTSINDIITKLGISKWSFFHYFKDKNCLFIEVMDYFFNETNKKEFSEILTKEFPEKNDVIKLCKLIYWKFINLEMKWWCLLWNMSLELSDIDDFYRLKLKSLFIEREKSITLLIKNLNNTKIVKEPESIARYIIIYLEWIFLISKVYKDEEKCNKDFNLFLDVLDWLL